MPVVETLATLLTADADCRNEANLAALAALDVPALIADIDMRKRDKRFANRERHTTASNPLHDTSGTTKTARPPNRHGVPALQAEAAALVQGGIVQVDPLLAREKSSPDNSALAAARNGTPSARRGQTRPPSRRCHADRSCASSKTTARLPRRTSACDGHLHEMND